MNYSKLICKHCETENLVADCLNCKRSFVITESHIQGKSREFNDKSVQALPDNLEIQLCDFCNENKKGNSAKAVIAGLSQRTCPNCKTEFLSFYQR